ncbi:MAG: RcnB family protein [Sphingomonas sp.]
MKKFLLGAAAATMIASPILAAAPASAADWHGRAGHDSRTDRYNGHQQYRPQAQRHDYRRDYRAPARVAYRQTYRPTYRQWNRGERFDYRYAPNYRVITDYRDYGLQAPAYGYRWERSGNDAVLVALASGLIGAVVGGAIN